jgi:hypothetical protein
MANLPTRPRTMERRLDQEGATARQPAEATMELLRKTVKCKTHGIWGHKYILRGLNAVPAPGNGCWRCAGSNRTAKPGAGSTTR